MRMASTPDRAHSTAELAAEFGLSRHHLSKIVQRLARGGIAADHRQAQAPRVDAGRAEEAYVGKLAHGVSLANGHLRGRDAGWSV